MRSVTVEIVAQTPEDAQAIERAGADRIELCATLEVGGITPSVGLFKAVRSVTRLPIAVMIRPRSGDFTYSAAELVAMVTDVQSFRALGADALVFGAVKEDGAIDAEACRRLVTEAPGTQCVFHRAFDQIADPFHALETIIDLGFTRVLTAGGRKTAPESTETLRRLIEQADGRIEILVGGGVRAENVTQVVAETAAKQVHLAPLVRRRTSAAFGDAYDPGWSICEHSVKQLLLALT